MRVNVEDFIKTIIFFVCFLTILLTVVICCGKKKKRSEDVEKAVEPSVVVEPKEESGTGEDPDNTGTSQACRTEKTERAETMKPQMASTVTNVETANGADHQTNIASKVHPSQTGGAGSPKGKLAAEGAYEAIAPEAKQTGGVGADEQQYVNIGLEDGGGGGKKVGSQMYQTVLTGKLSPTMIGKQKTGGKAANKVDSQLYKTMAAAPSKALNASVTKGTKKGPKVGADEYVTMAAAKQNALNASKMAKGGGKGGGKVGAEEYVTMQIAKQEALAASKLGKKPVGKGTDPAKGFAPQQQEEKYSTLYGVGDKMTTSKR